MNIPTDLKFHSSNHGPFFLLMGDKFGGEALHDFHLIEHLQNSCSIASVGVSGAEREKRNWRIQLSGSCQVSNSNSDANVI